MLPRENDSARKADVPPHLAEIYSQQREIAKSISTYKEALRLYPNTPEALNNLAWILATTPDAQLRNGAEAVKLAQRACELTLWKQTFFIGTLAAAHARPEISIRRCKRCQKACDSASAHGENCCY